MAERPPSARPGAVPPRPKAAQRPDRKPGGEPPTFSSEASPTLPPGPMELEMRPAHGTPTPEPPSTTTSFFPLPAARATPTLAPGPTPRLPSGAVPVVAPPPIAAPPGPPGGGIVGPVARPKEAPAPPPAAPRRAEARADSIRSLALVSAIVVMGIGAMVAIGLLVAVSVWIDRQDATLAPDVAPMPPPPPPPEPIPVMPDPIAVPAPRPVAPVAPRPAAPPPSPAPTAARAVSITIPVGLPYSSATISCPSKDFREQAKFQAGLAVVPGVPRETDCTVRFGGGPPASHSLRSADALVCEFPNEGQVACR